MNIYLINVFHEDGYVLKHRVFNSIHKWQAVLEEYRLAGTKVESTILTLE